MLHFNKKLCYRSNMSVDILSTAVQLYKNHIWKARSLEIAPFDKKKKEA